MRALCVFIAGFLLGIQVSGQTFTMGKGCQQQNQAGIALLKEKKYEEAYQTFSKMESDCKTKDAKEAWGVGKAESLNGLGKYQEAITVSDQALKLTKGKSLPALFQKATAQNRLKQYEASKATFSQIILLTEKNQNTKARASNFALMSALQSRQLGQNDSAHYYIDKALALEPANPDFVVQKGDVFFVEKKYDKAFEQYDKAVQMGKADLDMYVVRSNGRMKILQEKYGTTNVQQLRSAMTAAEKEQLCAELKKAIELGLKDMKQDMAASLICK